MATVFSTQYDSYGRLMHVWGPLDMASGRAAVQVVYMGATVTEQGVGMPAGSITLKAGATDITAMSYFSV